MITFIIALVIIWLLIGFSTIIIIAKFDEEAWDELTLGRLIMGTIGGLIIPIMWIVVNWDREIIKFNNKDFKGL